jgi:hypothetical protein
MVEERGLSEIEQNDPTSSFLVFGIASHLCHIGNSNQLSELPLELYTLLQDPLFIYLF